MVTRYTTLLLPLHKEQDKFPFTKTESLYLITAHLKFIHNRQETPANVALVAICRDILDICRDPYYFVILYKF